MTVVTISREYGAGGSTVAGLVAQRLGLEVIDRSIVSEVSRQLQMPVGDVESNEEHPTSLASRILDSFRYLDPPEMSAAWQPPYADVAFDPRQAVISRTEDLIREAARRGGVVIVGRGAGFVLAGVPEVTRVYLHAPLAARVKVAMTRTGLDEAGATRRLRETDANRAAYIRQLYHADWHDMSGYQLTIDTSVVSTEATADLIVAVVRAASPIAATAG